MGMKAAIAITRSTESITTTKAILLAALVVAGLNGCASTPSSKKGELISPLERLDISSGFGRRSPTRPHYGVDFRAPIGTPIAASGDAKVIFAGWQRGFGEVMKLDHGRKTETWYAHMSGFAVDVGDRVSQGETIGFVGKTGNATGPHLHFEVRKAGKPVDPMDHIGKRKRR